MKGFIAPLTLYLRPADPDDPDSGMENTSQDDPAAVEYWRGDMLKQAKKEIESLHQELDLCQSFHNLAVKERNLAWTQLEKKVTAAREG